MKLQFWTVGKAHESYVKEGVELFHKTHYQLLSGGMEHHCDAQKRSRFE